jgi:hypothetical protein
MEDDYQAPGRRAGRPSSRQGAVDLRPSCRESEHKCRHAGGVQPTAASLRTYEVRYSIIRGDWNLMFLEHFQRFNAKRSSKLYIYVHLS